MVKHDAGWLKQQRLQQISKAIAAQTEGHGSLDLGKMLSWVEYNIGLSREKAAEYVRLCCEVHDEWRVDGGLIQVGGGE